MIVAELRPDVSPPPAAVGEFVDPAGILVEAEGGHRPCRAVALVQLLSGDLEQCRLQNDALAEIVLAEPQLSAFGAVPLHDPPVAAVRELREVMEAKVLAGVEVPSSPGGAYLGDDRFAPFWAAAEETGAVVFIHPTTRGFQAPVFGDFYLWNTFGNPFETTITAAHMVMAGVMERQPGCSSSWPTAAAPCRRCADGSGTAGRSSRRRGRCCARTRRSRSRGCTSTPSRTTRRCCARWWSSRAASTCCSAPTTPFDMADPHPVATVRAAGLGARRRQGRSAGRAGDAAAPSAGCARDRRRRR